MYRHGNRTQCIHCINEHCSHFTQALPLNAQLILSSYSLDKWDCFKRLYVSDASLITLQSLRATLNCKQCLEYQYSKASPRKD